jgi:hypothetical protein
MRRLIWLVGLLLAGATWPASAADLKDPLARARQFYNERMFELAISTAEEAGRVPERADSADLIAARAYLERFRESADAADLVSARDRLRRINPERLGVRERSELIIGLGQGLYFEGAAGASAVVFESVLSGPVALTLAERERVLDWWASALDKDARDARASGSGDGDRAAIYLRIRERMQVELSLDPSNATASYWLTASAWGQGDLQGAWDAALAGWVRAPLASDHGAELRGDLDRLVQRGIIPERARALAQPPSALQAEWEGFKERWSK